MTISSTIRKAGPFVGSGSASAFPFAFKVFAASDLYVVRTDTALGADTVLVMGTDYSVSLNADQNANPGGTVTLTAGALATGLNLTVTSSLEYLQPTDLTNQGGFYPSVITNALDRLTIFCQQLYDAVNRSLKISVSTPAGVSTTLPVPAANKMIGWNADATALQNMDPTTIASIVAFGTANADQFTGNGSTTAFGLSANPGALANLDVSVGGVVQRPTTDYTWTGTTITFTTAPPAGVPILVRYMQALPQGTADAAAVTVADSGGYYPGATKTLESIAATIGLQSTFVTYDTTGVADAAPVIQAAIDAVDVRKTSYQQFSKVIYLPQGKCKIGASILHRNGVILVGERGCELRPTGNFPAIVQSPNSGSSSYSSLGIRGISIVGTNGTTNNAGGGLLNSNLSSQHGIQLGNTDQFNSASYLFVENCFIYSVGGNGIHVYKPTVSNSQYGWTQFGHISDVTVQGCGGWGIYADGATATGADFASMETYRVHLQNNYGGGAYINGGNDNKLRFTVNNTGVAVTPAGTFTNPAAGPSIQLEQQLNTQLWCHIENNTSGEGLVVGRNTVCYTTKIEGLFYNLASPIKLDKVNGAKIGHAQYGTVPAGNYCVQTTTATRYLHIDKEWYKDTATSLFLLDANAGTVYAATGYIGINALGLGPTNQLYSGLISTSGEAIGYGTGSGVSVTQPTSKATTITANAVTGQITTFNDSLAANTTVVFAVNNNKVAVGDTVGINISSGPASPQAYIVRVARVGAGFFTVAIKNDTAGALAETLVLSYTVTKGAIA